MKNLKIDKIAALLLLTIVGCANDYEELTMPAKGSRKYAPYDIVWSQAADSASQAFVERFYADPDDASANHNGAYGVFTYSEYNRRGGNFNCYWQQAHAMGAMVEYYNRIKRSDAAEEARIRGYFKKGYDKRGNNYEGNSSWRGSTGFGNDFSDDTNWITIALLQMSEAVSETDPDAAATYYAAAKRTWDECVVPRFALNEYGWLPWKMTDLGANECTNGPGCIIACMLAQDARDRGDETAAAAYLEQAYACFDQQLHVMTANGTLSGVPLSYTQGTCMESGRLLWKLTGNVGYLRKAIQAARGQMMSGGMNENYNGEYVMRDEGADENNSIFHAVLFHWATRMILDTEIDSFDRSIRRELYNYVNRHASYYWTRGIRKSEIEWKDSYFGVKCYEPREAGTGGSLGAFTSAAQAIESMCMIEDVQF